jgi:protein-S-isoprenylcysteine O-methyltransferase Ste14
VTTTTAAPNPRSARAITWRDAVTPYGRTSRRCWTACYAVLLVLLALWAIDDRLAAGSGGDRPLPLILVAGPCVVFGMLRRGTRRIAALDHPMLDERDVAARNSAYRIAFPLFLLVVIAGLVLVAVTAPGMTHTTRLSPTDSVGTGGSFISATGLVALGLWFVLWAVFLPTGVLAWREPDALEPELVLPRLPEPVRDGLLALALGGALYSGLAGGSNTGALVFAAALALLGVLARRSGEATLSSQPSQWRLVIAIGLILALLGIGLFAGTRVSSGGSETPAPQRAR